MSLSPSIPTPTRVATESSRSDVPTPHHDLLSWIPCATRVVVADNLLRGHPDCVSYSISSWPESVIPEADWEYFDSLPATTPSLPMVVLLSPSHRRLEVRPTSHFVSVADVLRSLYDIRALFPNTTLRGFSYAGLHHLRVHLDQ